MTARLLRLAPALLALLAALLAAAVYLVFPKGPIVSPDSYVYARFGPLAPAGYPLFLRLVGVGQAPVVQLAVYAASAWVLAWAVLRRLGRPFLAALIVAAAFANPEVDGFHAHILSESVFLSVDLLLFAALLLGLTGSPRWLIAAGALAGLAVAVRPISYPLVVIVLIAALLAPGAGRLRRRLPLVLLCLLAWAAVVGGERMLTHWVQGGAETSLTGPHLFAKATLIDAPPIDRSGLCPLERRYADVMEDGYRPVRDLMGEARGTEVYPVLRGFYEVCIQHGCSASVRDASGATQAQGNAAMMKVALRRIERNPAGFARLTLGEFRSLWLLNSRTHPAFARRYDAFVAAHRPLPLEGQLNGNVVQPTAASRAAYVIRPAVALIGLATAAIVLLGAVIVARRRKGDPLLLVSILAALSVHAVFAFAALAAIGDGRYTMGMWPNMAIALLFAAAWVCTGAAEWAKRRKRTEDHGHND